MGCRLLFIACCSVPAVLSSVKAPCRAKLVVPMKVLVFYRPNSEHARIVEEFVHDLQRQHDVDERHLVVYDIDSREGSAMASLYDLMSYPSLIVVGDDGAFVKSWTDGSLPLMNEVVSYTFTF